MGTVPVTCYAQIEPTYSWDDTRVVGAKVVAMTQKEPFRPKGGSIVVMLTMAVDVDAFEPLRAVAVAVGPKNSEPIHVVADSP